MKIALLTEKYTPDIGGLAISAGRLANLLSTAGHSVRVFAPTSNLLPSEKRTLSFEGVTVNRFGAHKRVDDTLVDWSEFIVEEHKREPFDMLHAYFLPQAGFVAAYAGKYLNIPSVVSIRGNDIERAAFDPSRFSHIMYALQNASAVTTNASELMKKTRAFIDREIVLIPNGVDVKHFKPMTRNDVLAESLSLNRPVILSEAKGLSDNQRDSSVAPLPQSDMLPVIGFVGELREKKGLLTLLSAYAQVIKERDAILLIVGDVRVGEDKQVFDEIRTSIIRESKSRVSNMEDRIIVTGYVSPKDLPAYYSLMDVFVHPSLRDGLPNALLEAMACEKPVIAAPVGGILDAITDCENGRLVSVNDANALANTIEELLNDESLRSRLARKARETISNKFTLQAELDANLGVYSKLGLKI
ncbi:MAG: glycosyltransferase family 4 protein [Chloroflexi bacterium]|nr:glycosyltransferase family 4 protein [Chloroflexota bacterium]